MPRSGPDYQIDNAWRERVERELAKRGWSRSDLAREAGCSRSVITELLNGTSSASPYIPDIHSAFNWSPPHGSTFDEETDELLTIWRQLDRIRRAVMLERARSLLDEQKRSPRGSGR